MRTKFKFLAVVIAMLAALLPMQPATAATSTLNLALPGYEGRNEGNLAAFGNQIIANGITSNAAVNFIDPKTMALVETVQIGVSGLHFATPVVSNENLYYTFHNTNMPGNAALSTLLRWPLYITKYDTASHSFEAPVFVCDKPGYDAATAFDGQLFVPCTDKLVILNESDLSIADEIIFSGHGSQPAITGDYLWAPIHDTYVSQIDRATGQEVAQLTGCPMNQAVYATGNELVCVGLHEVLWYDLEGTYLGRYSLPFDGMGAYYRSVDETGVWICNMSSNSISHFNFSSKSVDRTETTSAPTSGSALLNGALFVATSDAKITRIGDYVEPPVVKNGDTPSIIGNPVVGESLYAAPGVWDDGATFSYIWSADGMPINGGNSDTYTPVAGDLGHQIVVTVVGSWPGSPDVAMTSAPVTIEEGASGPGGGDGGGGNGGGGEILDAPVSALLGDAITFETLTADTSAWPQDIALSFQWFIDGEPIQGATESTYVLASTDGGHAISVAITGAPDGTNVLSSTSDALDVSLAEQTLTPTPEITGVSKVGKTLTAVTGDWADGVEFEYQWFIDDDAVEGATEATFELPAASLGLFVNVSVTGNLEGYNPSTQTSDAQEVLLGTLVKTPVPTIGGSAKSGQKLTAVTGIWDADVEFAFEWKVAGKSVIGGDEKTFVIPGSALGKTITVTVTGSKDGYAEVSKTSKATGKVAIGAMNVFATPTIVGTVAGGKSVTVAPGKWVAGAKFAYVWMLDGKAIKGAKSAKLAIAKSAKGHKLSVSVTATAPGFTALTKVSKVVKVG